MRTLLLALATSLVLLAVVAPTATASHMGPCTHEYADAVVYAVQNYKNGGHKVIVPTVVYCATHVVDTDWIAPILP